MKRLIKIAQGFSSLDQLFAEFFLTSGHGSNHDVVRLSLRRIRIEILMRQRRHSDPGNSEFGYVGYLGEFCEDVCGSWSSTASQRKKNDYKSGLKYGKDCVTYLQDNLEIPYWELILDLFLAWRDNNWSSMLGTAFIHILRHKMLSLGSRAEELAQLALLDTDDKDGLEVALRCVRKRLSFLRDALEVAMPDGSLEVPAFVRNGSRAVDSGSDSGQNTAPELTMRVRQEPHFQCFEINAHTRLTPVQDALHHLALFITFVILAIIPGYQGFSISTKSHENGNTNDADFYFLMQSSIMSVLGNFATALPILQSAQAAGPARCFWAFSAIGLLSAVVSVVIYPSTNTGWSSMIAFVGAVASAASVLVLTMATPRRQVAGLKSSNNMVSSNDRMSSAKKPADRSKKRKRS